MLDLANTLTFLALFANSLLGFFVYLGGKRKILNISFALFSFITAFWVLDNLLFLLNPSMLYLKGQFAFGAITITSALIWILYLVKNYFKPWEVFLVGVASVILFVLPFLDGFLIENLNIISSDSYTFSTTPLFTIYTLFQAVIYLYFMGILFQGLKSSKPLKRRQISYVFTGGVLFGVIALTYGFFLFPFFNFTALGPLDAQSSLFFVGFSAYVILKHRFMDIRLVVARSVAYTLLLGILAGGYAAGIFLTGIYFFKGAPASAAQLAVNITLALLMAFTFQPLRRFLTKITDKIFFKAHYDPQELLANLSHTTSTTIELNKLLAELLDELLGQMRVGRGAFILFGKLKNYKKVKGGFFEFAIGKARFEQLFKTGQIIAFDELAEGRGKDFLRKNDISVLVPFRIKGETIGCLVLGEKASGDMYSKEDLDVLEIFAPEAAVAINNARLYQESLEFTEKLKKEVASATYRLRKSNEHLRELDKMKDEFISVASHDLRSPIAVIEGYLSMVTSGRTGKIPAKAKEFLDRSYKSVLFLVQLTKDLLDSSRIDQARLQLTIQDVAIGELIQEVADTVGERARTKGLALNLELAPHLPKIPADREKIIQVVANLITNAAKFTESGSITVGAERKGNLVKVSVSDTGRGVPEDKIGHLFEKFYRAHEAATDHPEGTGLGLYISKSVVELHGGKVGVSSTEGEGSTFWFTLPVSLSAQVAVKK